MSCSRSKMERVAQVCRNHPDKPGHSTSKRASPRPVEQMTISVKACVAQEVSPQPQIQDQNAHRKSLSQNALAALSSLDNAEQEIKRKLSLTPKEKIDGLDVEEKSDDDE